MPQKTALKVIIFCSFWTFLNNGSVFSETAEVDIEEDFNIEIPDEEAEKILTVKGIVEYLETHI